MKIKLYNTLSRNIEDFVPQAPGHVSLYTCGPTVYNYAHIGNLRAYIFSDILKRVLLYNGLEVNHIMNLTDIDDKTIRDSQKAGQTLKEFTEFYTKEFYTDRDALNILPATKYTKATDYIKEMVTMIETLLEKNYAYKENDGSVYFDIKKFPEYGKLSHIDMNEQKENASGRIKKDEYEKENAQDFALWKAWDENDGDVFWDPSTTLGTSTSLSKGRPGWHIECSAMSIANLGETIDIHTGGIDNMFPHHENEIAQSECATGKTFANYFMHNEHLLVDGKKMSKSAGNFYTLRDIVAKGYNPIAFRYLALQNSYRTPLNFTFDSLDGAQSALKKMYNIFLKLGAEYGNINKNYEDEFITAINSDLGVSQALGIAWKMLGDESVSKADKKATILKFDEVFGLGLLNVNKIEIPDEIIKLKEEREYARSQKNWASSDEIRIIIEEKGYKVIDSDSISTIEKI